MNTLASPRSMEYALQEVITKLAVRYRAERSLTRTLSQFPRRAALFNQMAPQYNFSGLPVSGYMSLISFHTKLVTLSLSY